MGNNEHLKFGFNHLHLRADGLFTDLSLRRKTDILLSATKLTCVYTIACVFAGCLRSRSLETALSPLAALLFHIPASATCSCAEHPSLS